MSDAEKGKNRSGTVYSDYKVAYPVMVELYPKLFSDTKKPKPLKVGIHADIFMDENSKRLSRKAIRNFLYIWTHRSEYKAMLNDQSERYGLDGNVV